MLNKRKRQKLYKKALDLWGEDLQLMMVIEEMAELTKAISKCRRKKVHAKILLLEEIADVEIMLEQLRVMVDFDEEIDEIKVKKLMRLSNLINSEINLG